MSWPVRTWVLLEPAGAIPAGVSAAISHPGIEGLSFAEPWDNVETSPGVYDFTKATAAAAIASAAGKKFAYRIRGGAHTPAWAMGRTWVPTAGQAIGVTIPNPCETTGAPNATFGTAFTNLFNAAAAWCLAHNCFFLHFTWYGGLSAELFETTELLTLAGCSSANVRAAHLSLLAMAQGISNSITIEFPASGFTVPSSGLRGAIATAMSANPRPQYLQENNMDDGTWHTWPYSYAPHGNQMVHADPPAPRTDEWDWPTVYSNSVLSLADYVEIQFNCFNSNTAPNKAQLYANALAFSPGDVWDSPTVTWDSPTVAWDGGTVDPTIKRGVGRITGTGLLTATGSHIKQHGIGQISGGGTLSGTGTIVTGARITGAVVGRGTLAGAGHVRTSGVGRVSGQGTLTGRGNIGPLAAPVAERQFRIGKRTGGSRLGGPDRLGGRIGTLVSAVQFHIGGALASRLGGTDKIGGLDQLVTGVLNGVGAVTGTGTLTATGHIARHGIGSITGTGTLTGTGHVVQHGVGRVSGQGALIATGHRRLKGVGRISGTGTLSATGNRGANARGSVVGTGTLAGRGTIAGRVSGDLVGHGTLTGTGHIVQHGVGRVSGTGTLTGRSTYSRGRGQLLGTGTLSGNGHLVAYAQGQVLGTGTLSANGSLLEEGHGADFGPTRELVGVGSGRNRVDLMGDHDDEGLG